LFTVLFSGVGFGICHRFLVQLSERAPPDALLNLSGVPQNLESRKGYDGLTLIMACRNLKLAEVARTKLYKLLDAHILQLKRAPGYDGHADSFRRNLQIDIHHVDLAVVDSVLQFSRIIRIK
jgi:3-keto steroid reductase